VQADFAGIEGGVAAWLADEHGKVQALHEIMADPSLPDMYRRTAASILGLHCRGRHQEALGAPGSR
jgi:DNA polymerase